MDDASLQERFDIMEDEQQVAQEAGEALVRLLQRLITIAEGQDKNFDQQLSAITDMLQSFPPPPAFINRANSIVSSSVKAVQGRDNLHQDNFDAFQKLGRQLSSLEPESDIASQLDDFLDSCKNQVGHFYDYPELLGVIVDLQMKTLRSVDERGAKGGTQSSGEGASDEADESENQVLVCRHIGSLLLKLLEKITIPASMQPRARKLLSAVESGFTWDELEKVLADSIDLAVKATVSGHQDFEVYLKSLNSQLGDIQSFLTESRSYQKEAKASADKLDQTLRDDVAQMEISLNSSEDLEQLKCSVREQLSGIVSAVDQYREEQTDREAKAEARLTALNERIDEMERKSADVQKKLEEQKLLAALDPLTGLPNRGGYDEKVKQLLGKEAARYAPMTMVVCDIDHFKSVNDDYGHLAGDNVLRIIAKILRGGVKDADFVGRYGGEEFVMMLPNTKAADAKNVLDKLRRVIQQSPFNFKGNPLRVTASFGIAEANPSEAAEDLFARADKVLYRAKEEGRNRCLIAD